MRGRVARGDAGAALIMALFFIVIIAIGLTALITFAGGALLNTSNLRSQRSLEYAADTGADLAIQAVRYSATAFDKATGTPLATPAKCFGPATFGTPGATTGSTTGVYTVVAYCKGKDRFPLPHTGPKSVAVTSGSTTLTTATLFGGSTSRYVGFVLVDSTGAFPSTTTPTKTTTEFIITAETSAGTVTVSHAAKKTVAKDQLTVFPAVERTVTFFVCVAKGTSAPSCPTKTVTGTPKPNYTVHAVVGFNDVSGKSFYCGAPSSTTPPPTPTCGTSMSVGEWVETFANA